jgi:short-subunit dehydrogenase involved in D-alanine esterification of teichoic acids
MELSTKRVLITGGTGGIGGALARALAAEGARVIVTGRDQGRLEAMAAEGFETFSAELEQPSAAQTLVAQVLRAGPLDVLINNAAIQVLMDLRSDQVGSQLADLDRELDLNLRAPIHLTRLLLPTLLTRPAAAVVNVTSGLALVPKQSAPGYCATKAALHSFSIALRWQLEGTSVKVFEALPPLVDTAMTKGRGTGKLSPEACAKEIVAGLRADRTTLLVGKSALLARVSRWAPEFAARRMRHG